MLKLHVNVLYLQCLHVLHLQCLHVHVLHNPIYIYVKVRYALKMSIYSVLKTQSFWAAIVKDSAYIILYTTCNIIPDKHYCMTYQCVIKNDGWMNQAYSRLSTTHGHITDCKLLVYMYWTRLVLV